MSTRYFHRRAQFDAARGIPIQQPDRRPPHWRDAVHGGVLQYETIVPAVFARIEEQNERSRAGVDARQIETFVFVASVAG